MVIDEGRYRAAEAAMFAHYGVDVREHRIAVATPATRVRVLEVGSGTPILCVHGSPNCAATWIPLAATAPGFRWLFLERPGAGLSDPAAWTGDHRRDAVAIVDRVLEVLGVGEVDLVGSSFGALYTYPYAIQRPDRVRHLVVMGAPAGPTLLPFPFILRLLAAPLVPAILKAGMPTDPASLRKMFRDIGHGPTIDRGGVPDAMFDQYKALLDHTATMDGLVAEARAVASPFGLRRGVALTPDELAAIRAPTLVLWGDLDNFATPAQAERLTAATPGARLERFAGFGHLPWIDDPAGIGRRIAAFVADGATRAALG